MERRGKKLLGTGFFLLIETLTLPETGNAWPSDGDGAGVRGDRDAGFGVGGKREGKKLLRT